MDEKTLNYLKKEYAKCFEGKECINPTRAAELFDIKEIRQWLFSKERLESNAKQEDDLLLKSSSESFLEKAYPPSWYWEMPDYYYPGIYNELHADQEDSFPKTNNPSYAFEQISATTTRNEAALIDLGWNRKKYDVLEYYNDNFPNLKIVFNKDNDSVLLVRFNENNETVGEIEFPFSMICAVFLKCRELEYRKPHNLRAHDLKERFPDLVNKK